MKSEYPLIQETIRNAESPREALRQGRNIRPRSDWNEVKFGVMRKVIWAKFTQHESLKQLLLSTGEEELIEDSPIDRVWGCGKDGTGANWLGKILMETREKIRLGKILTNAKEDIDIGNQPIVY